MSPQQQIQQAMAQQLGPLHLPGNPQSQSVPIWPPPPPKPTPVMPKPNVTEQWASWLMLTVGAMTWVAILVAIAVWHVDVSVATLTLFLGATTAGLWFVRRHELHERKRAYMADVMASQ